MTKHPQIQLFLSDARGIYIPRDFAESIKTECLSGVKADDLEILKSGPDHEWYWEAWNDLLRDAVVTDLDGTKYNVYQDGDCWLIPDGMEWSDEEEWFYWADEIIEE